ncbi:uncharacterized protein LOC128989109 [Macrosteles quadrilineatus]|uniref:uncharacterized protein LOC128989109 n=1 Tax=Macrosteles quadrilineatus TaxID=74068 RepID=UPI0023E16926|nr:uncharacterized protein LOC128989109 [Macrosteles quadrilineatus]
MTIDGLDMKAELINRSMLKAYEVYCPLKTKRTTRNVPWWNERLSKMRCKLRKLFNTTKRTRDWANYSRALMEYNSETRKSKRKTWRQFCEGIQNLPESARLQKALQRDVPNPLGTLIREDGSHTTGMEETLEVLMNTHFRGNTPLGNSTGQHLIPWNRKSPREIAMARRFSSKLFKPEVVKWAVESFSSFKSPGGDGIFPALIQEGLEVLINHMIALFRGSFALGYIQIYAAVRSRGISPDLAAWINALLKSREVTAELGG